MTKTIFNILAVFIIGICGGIFADQIIWPYFVERPLFYQYRLDQNQGCIIEKKEVIVQENTALQTAVEKVDKVVVGVKTITKSKILQGSGLILTSDGLVVTLASLVPQGSDFNFFIDGKIAPFQILKRDLKENLALIKVKENDLSTLGFADIDKLKIGERVFLVGVIFDKGKIKKIANEGMVKYFDEDVIVTNIFETTTLAGSPLFDIEGKLLGLNVVDEWGRVTSIPITKIKTFAGF